MNKFKQIMKDAAKLMWQDIKNARWAIVLIIAYFLVLNVILHGTCPFVLFTGYPCAACGLTRAAKALLHLDFAGAFKMHAFIYGVVFLVVFLIINRYFLKRKIPKWIYTFVIVSVILMLVYYIYRMAKYFPDTPPMTFYYNNLFGIKLYMK